MPSKRTNDSVDRILQDLGQKQNAEGIRDRMTDRQVDEILASVGIDVGSAGSVLVPIADEDLPDMEVGGDKPPVDRFSTAVLDDLLGDLPSLRGASAPKPAPKQPAQPVQTVQPLRVEPPVRTATPKPVTPSAPTPRTAGRDTAPSRAGGTAGDTTRTGIIKGFLAKMAPEGAEADSAALNEGKEQFMKYFGNSAAVLKDEHGRLIDPSRRKRKGLFGLANAEETGEFVPINVSLGGGRNAEREPEPQPEPQQPSPSKYAVRAEKAEKPEQEYYPDAPEAAPAPARGEPARQGYSSGKKKGFFAGLFGGKSDTREELLIPEAREEPEDENPPLRFEDTAPLPLRKPSAFQPEIPPQPLTPPPADEQVTAELSRRVYRSKYPAAQPAQDTEGTLGGDTLGFLRDAIKSRTSGIPVQGGGQTATIYRKKRNTVEFTPGKRKNEKPAALPRQPEAEPVGEPVMTPNAQLAPPEPPTVYPVREQPQPVQPPEPQSATTGFTVQMGAASEREDTQDFLAGLSAPQPAATQTPQQPAPAQAGENVPAPVQAGENVKDKAKVDTSTFDEIPVAVTQTLTGQVRLADIQARAATLQPGRRAQPAAPAGEGKLDKATFASGIARSINFEEEEPTLTRGQRSLRGEMPAEIPDDDGRYASAVSRLRDEQPPAGEDGQPDEPKRKKAHHGLHLGGTAADEQDSITEPFARPVVPQQDYDTPDDAAVVRKELEKQVLSLGVAAVVAGIFGAVLLYFGTAASGSVLPLPTPLSLAAGKTPLLVVMLVLLAAVCVLSWRTVLEGLRGLTRTPSPDSLPLLAAVGAVAQLVVFLVKPELWEPARFCLLAGPAALLLCLNNVGKLLAARTAADNFKLVSAGVDHAVAYRLRDASVLRAVTGGLAEPHPCVLVSRPTQLLKKFMASSAAHGTSDKNQQQFAWIVGVCGLISFLFTLLYRKDAGMAVTALAATLCLGAPLAGTLLSALPARLMQRSAAQVGAVIPGWKDIRQLGRINVVQVTARDLFPAGCVKLGGIKAVNDDHIYTAIVYAASLLANAGENMREVFLGMIGDTSKQLCKVDDLQNVYGKGCVGWINGERVLIGNRAMMQDYSIRLPDLAYEQRHTVNQRRVIYLAVSGKLFAMFQVSYERDPDTAAVLDSLRHSGMSLIVDCDDFNCDARLLETAYGLPVGSVKVLSSTERTTMAPATAWLPESEGNMLHLGSFASFVGGLEAAAGAAEGERKSAMVLTASVLLSCLLAVVMALAGGLAALPLPALVLYQAAWAVLALIFPLLQRY